MVVEGGGACRGISQRKSPLHSFSGSGNLGEKSLGRAAPQARSLPRTAPLARGTAALESQQKGQEAGPAAVAAFREGGGSGEGFAVRRWLKVPGKGLGSDSSRRLPKLGDRFLQRPEKSARPLCSGKGLRGDGRREGPPWRARPQPNECAPLLTSKSNACASPSPRRFAGKRGSRWALQAPDSPRVASQRCLGFPGAERRAHRAKAPCSETRGRAG